MKKLSLLLASCAFALCATITPAAAQQTPPVAVTGCTAGDANCILAKAYADGKAGGGYYDGSWYWQSITLEQSRAYAEYHRQRVLSGIGTIFDSDQTVYWDYFGDGLEGVYGRTSRKE